MSRLTREDGTTEHVSRDQIVRHKRGQGNIYFPCSADHVHDWQPYPVDPYSYYMCDHTYINTSWTPKIVLDGVPLHIVEVQNMENNDVMPLVVVATVTFIPDLLPLVTRPVWRAERRLTIESACSLEGCHARLRGEAEVSWERSAMPQA